MVIREAVRSGRRANFFITENRFIDFYASKVRGTGVAVYSILQRCANSETKETWISADRMAEILDMDRSTVYRKLKELEDLKLIKSMRTRDKKIYIVLPVPPPRPEAGPTPLFDAINPDISDSESSRSYVAPTQEHPNGATESSARDASVASAQQTVSRERQSSGTSEKCNKEEQDLLNKTQEQEFINKTEKQEGEIQQGARRVLNILGLPSTALAAATAAVEFEAKRTRLSMDGIVAELVTEANWASRRNIENTEFLEEFLARKSAEQVLRDTNLPITNNVISAVAAALKAETKDAGITLNEAAVWVTNAAVEDRRKGLTIDRFYFENAKWRNRGQTGKGQQQFERIKRARDAAHAIIDAEMDH
jgi:hypothetical protein